MQLSFIPFLHGTNWYLTFTWTEKISTLVSCEIDCRLELSCCKKRQEKSPHQDFSFELKCFVHWLRAHKNAQNIQCSNFKFFNRPEHSDMLENCQTSKIFAHLDMLKNKQAPNFRVFYRWKYSKILNLQISRFLWALIPTFWKWKHILKRKQIPRFF